MERLLTDTISDDRHARQKRLMLTKPHDGWSREDYDRELRAYIDERGRAPQTATMHPHTAATLGLREEHSNGFTVHTRPLVVTSPDYAREVITLYY
jgi:hypothetical protein